MLVTSSTIVWASGAKIQSLVSMKSKSGSNFLALLNITSKILWKIVYLANSTQIVRAELSPSSRPIYSVVSAKYTLGRDLLSANQHQSQYLRAAIPPSSVNQRQVIVLPTCKNVRGGGRNKSTPSNLQVQKRKRKGCEILQEPLTLSTQRPQY